ncbi:unnamed protein product [Brassicogethes aeneus]|uniref:Protein arginine N-methyltransferase domain-containing protein n=1 Tax=Brassicogethes aeneus TaxID=1431903 RepID=A0A9P0FKM4_BRAAE|nr:unnamed protein product [Brassicogethes aeneus]
MYCFRAVLLFIRFWKESLLFTQIIKVVYFSNVNRLYINCPYLPQKTQMEGRVPNPKLMKTKKPTSTTINFLRNAIKFYKQEELTKAFESFVNYFEDLDDPAKSPNYAQNTFTRTICEMGAVLEETDNIEELLKCYLQAINLFPKNHVILNNLGGYMFKVGELDIARRYLESAVKCKPDYLPAERNLLHVKWHQMPRWHFRMLNDRSRNEAYAKAITKVIDEGYTNVVDIGAGCGLLSLIASEKGNTNVTAIEENKTLYKIFHDILRDLQIGNVRLLNCNSCELSSAPAPCNLIVTEIFDIALFGERALESLVHGLKTLVNYPKFKVIPASADLYVTGVTYSSAFFSKLTCYNRFITDIAALNLRNVCIRRADPEPYEGEYITKKVLDKTCRTDTVKICHIDFTNWEQLDQIINDDDFCYNIELKVLKSDWINSLVVWFDLNLTEDIKITTNPHDPNCLSAWEQAVFQLDHPIYMQCGETMRLKATVVDSELKFKVVDRDKKCDCIHVSNEVLRYLNDKYLIDAITRLANSYTDPNLRIVDMNVFPLFGFLMAKKGCQVYHICKEAHELDLYELIIKRNHIDPQKNDFCGKRLAGMSA